MSDKNHFILQGGAENHDFFLHNEIFADEQWFWTVPKGAKKGDIGFVYLCAPLSRIVGRVELTAEPVFNGLPYMFEAEVMRDKWCAEIGKVKYFREREELKFMGLKKLFGADWGWIRYPRGNTKVPAEILQPFLELMDG